MAQSWYPGHMAKAEAELAAMLKLIDVVIEIVDSRAPTATSNPALAVIAGRLPLVVALNKADLADEATTEAWRRHVRAAGGIAVATNSQTGAGIQAAMRAAVTAARSGSSRSGRGGGSGKGGGLRRRFRSAVVGMPNVGKSSFINRVSRRAGARVGDKPGVTRAKQWIVVGPDLELLDTPGIMPTRVDDQATWMKLCALGCVDDTLFDAEEVCRWLFPVLDEAGYRGFREKYSVQDDLSDPHVILEAVGKAWGLLAPGGAVDTARAALIFLRELRGGKLGRITLERPGGER